MILPFLAVIAAYQTESPRLITRLENGATVLVERMPTAKSVSVQLWAGPRGARETSATHGQRHLLEHLILKGKDTELEAQGILLLGRTYRDALQIEMTGTGSALEAMLHTVERIIAGREIAAEEIAREVQIMRTELALEGEASLLNRLTWKAAHGEAGLDPLGNLDMMAQTTPEVLAGLHKTLFAPSNLALVIAGPVDIATVTRKARAIAETWEGAPGTLVARKQGQPSRLESDEAIGEVRGAMVDGAREVAESLAAGYAIAARNEAAYVVYTPSAGAGLVLVGRTGRNNAIGQAIDALTEGDEAFLMPIGRAMARNYVDRLLETPSGSGYLRGAMLVLGGFSPDDLRRAITELDWRGFRDGVDRFRKHRAAVAVGVGR